MSRSNLLENPSQSNPAGASSGFSVRVFQLEPQLRKLRRHLPFLLIIPISPLKLDLMFRERSSNSESVYSFEKPPLTAALPTTARRETEGLECLRVPTLDSDIFGRTVRHFGMIARAHSASTVTIDEKSQRRMIFVLAHACDFEEPPAPNGIPLPPAERPFIVPYSIDLFPGGERATLSPGTYQVGAPIVDSGANGKVYLEITPIGDDGAKGVTFTAIVGLFHEQRNPASVDWRTVEAA